MRILQLLFFFISLFCVLACQDTPNTAKQRSHTEQQSPESIFRTWQAHIDRNEFEQARVLSTPSTVEWIDMIVPMLLEDITSPDSILLTQFLKLECTVSADTASCVYLTEEEGLRIEDSVRLVKLEGRWLVDFAEEEELSPEEMEEIRQEFKELLSDSLDATDLIQ